ncbi:MAG: hypothetical protein AAF433_10625 [Bacteroidota bacterium]
MLPKNDHLLIGVVAGVVVPFIAYALLLQLSDWLTDYYGRSILFTPRTLALVAISTNALVVNAFRRRYFNQAIRGLVVVTILLAIVWFVQFGKELL